MSFSLFFALPSSRITSRSTSSWLGQMTEMSCATSWWMAKISASFMYSVGFDLEYRSLNSSMSNWASTARMSIRLCQISSMRTSASEMYGLIGCR